MPAYTYFGVWLFLAAGLGIVWLCRFVAVGVVLRNRAVLGSRSYDSPPERAPRLSVILAAKDEENNIETCVTSLLEQDYPDFEIIVVDDRSTDATPTILRRLEATFGGEDGRLRIVTIKTLRDGWFGKCNVGLARERRKAASDARQGPEPQAEGLFRWGCKQSHQTRCRFRPTWRNKSARKASKTAFLASWGALTHPQIMLRRPFSQPSSTGLTAFRTDT